jgi:hypothetical protein
MNIIVRARQIPPKAILKVFDLFNMITSRQFYQLDAVDAAVCTDVALECLTAHIIIAVITSAISLISVATAHVDYTAVSLAVFIIVRVHVSSRSELV